MTEISSLTGLAAAPADGDQFVILDVSDTTQSANGTTKKLAASRLARTGAENTFTSVQNFEPAATDADGIIVDMPTGTSRNSLNCRYNGNALMVHYCRADLNALQLLSFDNTTSTAAYLDVGRNSNASTPAAGFVRLRDKSNDFHHLWVDDSGLLRIATGPSSAPLNGTDGSGTVVGTQTSWHAAKENVREWDGAEALDAIRSLTLYSYEMIEDSQETPDGGKPTYHGIVIMDEDREANAWFGLGYAEKQIPALNDRNLFGYMLAAIRHGGDIIEALQTQVAALEARVAALEGA